MPARGKAGKPHTECAGGTHFFPSRRWVYSRSLRSRRRLAQTPERPVARSNGEAKAPRRLALPPLPLHVDTTLGLTHQNARSLAPVTSSAKFAKFAPVPLAPLQRSALVRCGRCLRAPPESHYPVKPQAERRTDATVWAVGSAWGLRWGEVGAVSCIHPSSRVRRGLVSEKRTSVG